MSRHHAAVLSVVGLCLIAHALPAAQKAAPKAKANAAPANAQRALDQLNKVGLAVQNDEPVLEADAIAMLLAIHRTQTDKTTMQTAHVVFGAAVWNARSKESQDQRDLAIGLAAKRRIDQALVAWWNKTDADLNRGGLPAALIDAGQVYLAEYFRKTVQRSESQNCLSRYEPLLNNAQIHPSFPGMYWTVKGLLAEQEHSLALAHQCHARALQVRQQTPMTQDIAQAHVNLGLIHLQLGDYATAKSQLDTAKNLYLRSRNPPRLDIVHLLSNRSKALEIERDYKAVLDQLNEAEVHVPLIARPSDQRDAKLLLRNNRALVHYLRGEFVQAQHGFQSCWDELKALPGDPDLRLGLVGANLGWVALTAGHVAEARQKFNDAHTLLVNRSPGHHRIAEIAAYLARAEVACEKPDQARALLRAALDERERELQQFLQTNPSQRDRLAYVQKLRVHPESIAWPGAFDTWLELADALDVSHRDQYQEVLAWKGVLARHKNAEPIEPEDVIAALPAGAVLVDILETRRYLPREAGQAVTDDREYVAFVIQASGTIKRLDLGKAEGIDTAVKALNQLLGQKKEHSLQRDRLGTLVGKPLREATTGAELLIIAGDGGLNRVPWCALPGVEKKNYWVEEVTVATVPFAQSLVSRSKRAPAATAPSWLLVGGVDYGKGPGTFKPLPSSAQEVGRIDAFLTSRYKPKLPQPVLQGNAAKRESVVKLLTARPGPRLVHLATHGEFPDPGARGAFDVLDATKALDSMLVFAGANNADERASALWTAGEVGTLDLAHVDLMVLAACKSGLGHIAAGQGQVGLLGALDQAQVGTVVASLWQVDDDATGQLMDRFYTRHFDKQNPVSAAQALRQAQLDLLGDPARSDPYFWAAWMLMGKP